MIVEQCISCGKKFKLEPHKSTLEFVLKFQKHKKECRLK